MKLHVVNTGNLKLDGGAMFGVVPKSIWNTLYPADGNNMISLAMRCLLIEDGNKLILIDNGIGDKQEEKFFKHYYLHGEDSLAKSLSEKGFSFDDVTDVFLTHLHFDHCGGSIVRSGETLVPAFRNATYWSNADHWKWATEPNPREKASFLKENILPIKESGQLKFVDPAAGSPFPQFDIYYASGHTDGMMLPLISYKGKRIAYVSDLIPTSAHIPIPYVMGYDTRPLLSMEEKKDFLDQAVAGDTVLFFEHDHAVECCTLSQTERGVRKGDVFMLSEI